MNKEIKFDDLVKIGEIHAIIENLIHSSSLHEDVIEALIAPFEKILTENGVNLQDKDI